MSTNLLAPMVYSLFSDTANDIDSFFRTPSLMSPRNWFANSEIRTSLPIDIVDKGENYEVRVNVAGLSKSNINIHVDGRRLSVTYNNSEQKESYYLRESVKESISRSIILPVDMDEQNISDATWTDGLVKFTIGKAKPVNKTKTIAIT
jgi:HSP20 family molecular chaperone IbpA